MRQLWPVVHTVGAEGAARAADDVLAEAAADIVRRRSITGREAVGPMSPRPSTAVPSVTTATVWDFHV